MDVQGVFTTSCLDVQGVSSPTVAWTCRVRVYGYWVRLSSVGFFIGLLSSVHAVFIYNIYNHILCFYKKIVVWMRVRDVCSRIHLGGSGCSWYSIGACKTVCPSLVLLVLCVFCSNILYVSRLLLREYWSCGNLISIAFRRRMSRLQDI